MRSSTGTRDLPKTSLSTNHRVYPPEWPLIPCAPHVCGQSANRHAPTCRQQRHVKRKFRDQINSSNATYRQLHTDRPQKSLSRDPHRRHQSTSKMPTLLPSRTSPPNSANPMPSVPRPNLTSPTAARKTSSKNAVANAATQSLPLSRHLPRHRP